MYYTEIYTSEHKHNFYIKLNIDKIIVRICLIFLMSSKESMKRLIFSYKHYQDKYKTILYQLRLCLLR